MILPCYEPPPYVKYDGNPDNRFVPFAVEEGGRIGTDAETLVDAIVRAGSTDGSTL